MRADRPPIVGNQTGMDGFTGFGGQMGSHIGNQTDVMVTSGLRGAVTQIDTVSGARETVGGGTSVPVPGDKDETIVTIEGSYGDASAISPTKGAPGKSSFLDGHAFLIILGAGAIALALWGWK